MNYLNINAVRSTYTYDGVSYGAARVSRILAYKDK